MNISLLIKTQFPEFFMRLRVNFRLGETRRTGILMRVWRQAAQPTCRQAALPRWVRPAKAAALSLIVSPHSFGAKGLIELAEDLGEVSEQLTDAAAAEDDLRLSVMQIQSVSYTHLTLPTKRIV